MRRTDRKGWLGLILMTWACWQVSPALAQRRTAEANETVKLKTRDGVQLRATYYRSDLGKDAVPIVMLHDFKESARCLQRPCPRFAEPPRRRTPLPCNPHG